MNHLSNFTSRILHTEKQDSICEKALVIVKRLINYSEMITVKRKLQKILIAFVAISIYQMACGQDLQVLNAQKFIEERGEVYFQFKMDDQSPVREQLENLTGSISIDNVQKKLVTAYANKKEFKNFLKSGIDFEVLTPPSMLHQPHMKDSHEMNSRTEWDFYPTYGGYLDIMDQFVDDYPDLCELVVIETLASERQIIALHINDSLGVEQDEPEFLYTSSMHGDELTGYVLSLHLIEHLLENYGTDERLTTLVNNVDIWINPLANPDGTYAGGDHTVYGATRGNVNGVDLNRNYPDPEDGQHPDGNAWQPETEAFMAFAEEHDFVMSSNFHDGAELCNYPWDTWSKRHADDDWWYYVCRQWADTVHVYGPNGYFDDLDNGVTNGYDWYSIAGGRQDYMNYFHHCREFTLEISNVKIPPANQLPDFWEYHHRSMLNYMEQSLYGIRGKVTNAINGNTVPAEVWVEDHDKDESHVFASMPVGNYHRPIKEGTYNLTFSSFGYYDMTIENVEPEDMGTLILDVELQPFVTLSADFTASDTILEKGGIIGFTDNSQGNNIISWEWTFEGGEPGSSEEQHPAGIIYAENGRFDVSLTVKDNQGGTNTLTKNEYILVTDAHNMKDTTIYLCDGLFYDSGGDTENYQDGEDHTITFVSLYESGMLEVLFFEFEIEEDNDCFNDYIEVFDGMDVNAPFIGKWCGTEIPNSITAHNINGALTFRFRSNETLNYPGWKAFVTCDTSVGLKEMNEENIFIYPNPANYYFKISSENAIDRLAIYDLSGKLVLQENMINSTKTINVDHLRRGIYLLRIETQGKVLNEKLILN